MERYVHDAVLDMEIARHELKAELDAIGPDDWSRGVPYGTRTLHELLAHITAADHAWAVAARGLLKGEAEERPAGRKPKGASRRTLLPPPDGLMEEMDSRRRLLLTLFEFLEKRHLALPLPEFGQQHNSVRERIWVGYHDRQHAADVRRAMRLSWHAPKLKFLAEVEPAVAALDTDLTLYTIFNVDAVYWERPSRVPGWLYRQLLAHVATGDWVLQTHLRHVLEHGRVAEWPDVTAGNADRLEERRHSTHGALTDEYLSMRHATLLLISQLKRKHLGLKIEFWWEPQPNVHTVLDYLRMFEAHDRQHREQLRPAMKYATAQGGQ